MISVTITLASVLQTLASYTLSARFQPYSLQAESALELSLTKLIIFEEVGMGFELHYFGLNLLHPLSDSMMASLVHFVELGQLTRFGLRSSLSVGYLSSRFLVE